MLALSMAHSSSWLRRSTRRALIPPAILIGVTLLLASARPACAQLAKVETPEVCLVYVPDESFLVPHAARTFLNSLEFQRRLFGFDPADGHGVAGRFLGRRQRRRVGRAARRAHLQIAPLSFAFETIAANERMNTIMNHELVHVATMDQPARSRSDVPAAVRREGATDRRAAGDRSSTST